MMAGIISFCTKEQLEQLHIKYPDCWETVQHMASNLLDRMCCCFNNSSLLKRPSSVLWKRALTKVKLLSRWSSLGKDHNRKWLFKLKEMVDKLVIEETSVQDTLAACMILTDLKQKLFVSIVSNVSHNQNTVIC